ncbi:MAG: GGDEF domain-containing protein [Rhodospirillales bacterium]|nr:GGDEF domain-containing protein [Rhodospirillales bacterium]
MATTARERPTTSDRKAPESADPGALAAIVAAYPGPAAYLAGDGRIAVANAAAGPVLGKLAGIGGGLAGLVGEIAEGGSARAELVALPGGAAPASIEIVFTPVAGGVLALGRDVSLDANLRGALIESRQRYKDLVEISSDFTWETDAGGAFSFVSPRGALGWRATELLARPAASLLAEAAPDSRAASPFVATRPVEQAEFWLRCADGRLACVALSAVPLYAKDGAWLGARGVGRDMTETRSRDAALAEARNRERLLAYIVRAIRDEVEPDAMLVAAATAASRALGADGCCIWRREADGFREIAAFGAPRPDGLDAERRLIVHAPPSGLAATSEDSPVEWNGAMVRAIGAFTRYRHAVNGAICLWRPAEREAWSAAESGLLADIAAQLGIAQAQIADHEALARLAHTDGLTGLLNRRSFVKQLERRLKHAGRTGRPGALVYLDLDNFKPVNDRWGHQRGDEALRALADQLREGVRVGDLAARLGGDEFALWLEETDVAGAVVKARALLELKAILAPFSGDAAHPLGLSVGIAVSIGDEAAATLLARADEAMYLAKRSGKGNFAIVDPQGGKEKS